MAVGRACSLFLLGDTLGLARGVFLEMIERSALVRLWSGD